MTSTSYHLGSFDAISCTVTISYVSQECLLRKPCWYVLRDIIPDKMCHYITEDNVFQQLAGNGGQRYFYLTILLLIIVLTAHDTREVDIQTTHKNGAD